MKLTRKSLFVIVFSVILLENSIIFFSDVEEREHFSHLIIVINSLIAVIIAVFVIFQESTDKIYHVKTRISVTLGLSFWFLANLTWAIYEMVFHVVPPIPSIGDFLWLSAYGFMGYHLIISFKKFRHRFNKKLIGTGIFVGAIFLGFMTFFTLSISTLENFRGISMFIVLLLYPVFATLLLVFSIILQIGLRQDTHHTVPWLCDSLATIAIVIADSWFVIAVITQNINDLWLSAVFINAHYFIIVGGLIWYSRYLTHNHHTSVMVKCYNAVQRKKVFSTILATSIILIAIFITPNPLNIFDNSSHHEYEKELGIAHAVTDFEEINLGILLPITGTLSSLGETGLNTLKIVVKDINNHLNDINSKYRIKLFIEDTKTDPHEALKKLKLLKEKGADVVIGPATSSATMYLKNYADKNDIMVISFSTSPSLTIPEDNIFRLVPDDTNQAKAVSEKMWNDGIRVIVPIWRSDVYGNDLLNLTKTNFENLGGIVVKGIEYDPPIGHFATSLNRVNYVYWGQELIILDSKVKELVAEYPLNEIGVYLIAFDEIVPILSQGNSHPLLEQVRWYGSEATTKYDKIITNRESSLFASNSKYIAPLYGFNETNNKKLEKYLNKYYDSHTEASLTFVGPYLYDSIWLATLAKIETNNTKDLEILKRAFHNVSNSHIGITGLTTLNDAGNRLHGTYDFWTIERNENNTNRLEWTNIDMS